MECLMSIHTYIHTYTRITRYNYLLERNCIPCQCHSRPTEQICIYSALKCCWQTPEQGPAFLTPNVDIHLPESVVLVGNLKKDDTHCQIIFIIIQWFAGHVLTTNPISPMPGPIITQIYIHNFQLCQNITYSKLHDAHFVMKSINDS